MLPVDIPGFPYAGGTRTDFAALPIGINNVMLSQAIADAFKERLPEFSLNTPMKWRGDTVNTVTQGGIVGSFRDYRYGNDAHWILCAWASNLCVRNSAVSRHR